MFRRGEFLFKTDDIETPLLKNGRTLAGSDQCDKPFQSEKRGTTFAAMKVVPQLRVIFRFDESQPAGHLAAGIVEKIKGELLQTANIAMSHF